jgi:hypothetical protein
LIGRTEDGEVIIIESKNGPTADLTENQKNAKNRVEQGQSLIPRGKKAEEAGLKPGEETEIADYQVDRWDTDGEEETE